MTKDLILARLRLLRNQEEKTKDEIVFLEGLIRNMHAKESKEAVEKNNQIKH